MKANEIRTKWLEFFKSKEHLILEPSSLIPKNDNSLLWINSGVANLKPYFEGTKNPPSPRLANSQKSLRTNDIENVGLTSRHHTFFEMLGNFSIGDYFKKEAILMAWEFLTSKKWLGIDPKYIYITYYKEDIEAKNIWNNEINIDKDHLIPMGKDTNFWDVGLGPCGPSSEIFFDRGKKFDNRGIEILKKDLENDRYIELWNIVFSQFNNNGNGKYTPLPRKNIDTGAGLERIASILQGTPTNFETDLFMPLIKEIEKHTNEKYDSDSYFTKDLRKAKVNTSFKIISDHIRSIIFAIADGQDPSSMGRGYVIRRLIRRSLTVASVNLKIKLNGEFLASLVNIVNKIMGDYYKYLKKEIPNIKKILKIEEESFMKIIDKANDLILNTKNFDSKKAFYIFESHGIPYDLSQSICETLSIKIDKKEFNKLLEKHQQLARNSAKDTIGMNKQDSNLDYYNNLNSEFIGYDTMESNSKVIGIIENNKPSKTITTKGTIILNKTPFYATSGGQEHDLGILKNKDFEFKINDVIKTSNGVHLHIGEVIKGKINIDDQITALVDKDIRHNTSINHSATHLAFYVFENILKSDLPQVGAFYNKDKFRFDFKFYPKFNTTEVINKVEKEVSKLISDNLKQETKILSFEQATKEGAKFMEDETYGKNVRTVKFGKDIIDLCGGTHIKQTSEIESFIITNFETKGSGIWRVEGLTTNKQVNEWKKVQIEKWEFELSAILKKYNNLNQKNNEIEKLIKSFKIAKSKLELSKVTSLFWDIQKQQNSFTSKINEDKINNIVKIIDLDKNKLLIENKDVFNLTMNNIDLKTIKTIYIKLVNKIDSEILIISSESKETKETSFVIGVNKSNNNVHLSKPLNSLRSKFNIRGGGGPQMVQAIINTKDYRNLITEIVKGC